jgi:PAS domain S-box-containing protein
MGHSASAKPIPNIELFRDVFNASPIGIAVENFDGQPLFVNPALCTILGFREDELLDKHCVQFSPPEDAEKDWALFQKLRAGLIDHYHLEKRYFRRDGSLVWGSLSLSLLNSHPSPLVLAMVDDITEKKRAEEALRASEERLRLAQKVAGIGTFERNIRTGVNTWTPEMESMYGVPLGSFGRTRGAFENLVHPDDRAQVVELIDDGLESGRQTSGEWRVIWPDGSVHWIAGRWQVIMDESGAPSRVIGVDMDITERKRAEQALADMTRKLVDAQEQERARIARELHDDICQRLAMLTIDLDLVPQIWPDLPTEVLSRMLELRQQTKHISAAVQSLSHDLHSSQLEHLGAVRGMKSWCEEFGKRQGMQIDCSHDVRSALSTEIGLCLFRVLQEALHNAAKHSGAKRIQVELSEKENSAEIYLTIVDLGKGFDLASVNQRKGLGLTSMRERVRLVNGTIAIESHPAAGTTIRVRVPLRSELNAFLKSA